MKPIRFAGVIAAAALATGMGALMSPGAATLDKALPTIGGRRYEARRGIFSGGFGSGLSRERRAGRGWTNRHVQRMAAKRRNVARNRAAHRGRA